MAKLLVLHGPNLNLLGSREPEIYGTDTLADIDARLQSMATTAGHDLACLQSNGEHVLIERIHQARTEGVGFIVINPGAFTHTSIALRDALLGVEIPFIEIHLSNVQAREEFRRTSYLSEIAKAVISGCGAQGYEFALQAAMAQVEQAAGEPQSKPATPAIAAATTSFTTARAPMAGTFYAAPEPGAARFVSPGTAVGVGDTLCIIESMKMMNEIPSEVEGVVVDALVNDGEAVAKGQGLFRIG